MTMDRTARATLDAPDDEIDLERWLFELSDADYQACARGHRAAGSYTDEHGRGTINVESIGGNLIIQHYRAARTGPSYVEMYSPRSACTCCTSSPSPRRCDGHSPPRRSRARLQNSPAQSTSRFALFCRCSVASWRQARS